MQMNDEDRANLERAYLEGLKFTNAMLTEFDPVTIATIMSNLSFSIYRTVLSDEDFEAMMDTISEYRGSVKPFAPEHRNLQ